MSDEDKTISLVNSLNLGLDSSPILESPESKNSFKGSAFELPSMQIEFLKNSSNDVKTSILYSCLLTALATAKKLNNSALDEQWIKEFSSILEGLGWVGQGTQHSGVVKSECVDVTRLGLRTLVILNYDLSHITSSIRSIEGFQPSLLAKRAMRSIFSSQTGDKGGYIVGIGGESGGQSVLNLVYYSGFITERGTEEIAINYFIQQSSYVLNEQIYKRVENTITQKISPKIDLIKGVDE